MAQKSHIEILKTLVKKGNAEHQKWNYFWELCYFMQHVLPYTLKYSMNETVQVRSSLQMHNVESMEEH